LPAYFGRFFRFPKERRLIFMKTLIILHGWQSSKEKWGKVKELLEKEEGGSKEIEVIAPDLPGFKAETTLERAWDLDDYVVWLEQFVAGREKFFLLGHSFGGRVAIKFAVKHSYRLSGLILVSAAGIKKEPTLIRKLMEKGSMLVRKMKFEETPILKNIWGVFKKFFYQFILGKTDYLMASGFLKKTIKNILKEDLSSILEKIEVPTCLIWGEEDKITPLEDAYLMKKKIKLSQLKIMKKVGHTPHLEEPEGLVKLIKEFLFFQGPRR